MLEGEGPLPLNGTWRLQLYVGAAASDRFCCVRNGAKARPGRHAVAAVLSEAAQAGLGAGMWRGGGGEGGGG
jgi:hypothetical protein